MCVVNDRFQHSANSAYKPVNTSFQEEEPLIEEPVGNRYSLQKPKDHLNGAYVIFFILGIGSLLPWNFFITAKQYWIYKLQNCSNQQDPKGHGIKLTSVWAAVWSWIAAALCSFWPYSE
uniref:Equilibrative nucleoside transporter 3 n=1 Tax=Chelonoidis abingdonii TaxID=106734 RepID=A0A8C0IPI1_CHEAB